MLRSVVLTLSDRTPHLGFRTVRRFASNPSSIEHVAGRIPNSTSSAVRTPILDRLPASPTKVLAAWSSDGSDGAPFASRFARCVSRVAGADSRASLAELDQNARVTHSAKGDRKSTRL